ncbi:MAG TPA: hypothetical protein VE964_14165, partial [Myxococcales bacterium]|nr:hypothetical protein [Myxococcales bacterium]
MRRYIRIGVLVCLGGVLAWRTHSCVAQIDAKQRAAQAQTERFLERTAEEPSTLPFNPQKRRALLAGVYRLRPDRRFLLAFEAIARLTGAPEEPVSPVFREGAWVLQAGKQELGRVPELPGFGDLFARLVAFARQRLPEARGATPATAGPALVWVDEARAELPRALARWRSGRSRDALAPAARASAALSFYTLDLLEVSDRLPAEALGLAALL